MSIRIYRPLKSNFKTQGFGENKPCVRVKPDSKKLYRPFQVTHCNQDNVTKFYPAIGLKGHNGVDWACWNGEPIYFSVDAKTTWTAKTEVDQDGGIGVDVISDEKIDGFRRKFRFWHLKEAKVYDGQNVVFGQLIGLGDSTGASSGHHLHWSMKYVDNNGETLGKGNGYYGAIDFAEYFENVFVLDVLGVKEKALSAIQLARKVIAQVQLFLSNR